MNLGDLLLLAFALGVAAAVAIVVHPRKPTPRHSIARGFGGPTYTQTDMADWRTEFRRSEQGEQEIQ
jgi:hypothetical protein